MNTFLTDKIFYKDNKLYYEDKIIENKNWHKLLIEYGWQKIDKAWLYRLNKYKTKKEKENSRWGILPVANDGNCFFRCISEALNTNTTEIIDFSDVREKISLEITDDNFLDIMNIYRVEYMVGEFRHQWDINSIKTKEDLKKELIKPGHNYWADHIIIQLFKNAYNLNLILLNEKNEYVKTNKCKIHCLGDNFDINKKTIVLYYIQNIHFNLIGYFSDNRMISIFDKLPEELIKIYELDSRKNILS